MLSSPFVRAADTARRAAAPLGLPVRYDERLRERDFGAFDGMTSRGIRERYPEEAERRQLLGKFWYRPPGGESWADVALRVRSVLATEALRHDGERLLVVSHQAVVMVFRYVLEELDEQQLLDVDRREQVANASVTRYQRASPTGGRCRSSTPSSTWRTPRSRRSPMSSPPESTLVTPQVLRDWRLPEPTGGKDARGSVLVVGGSTETLGAVLLAAEAALRSGAGKLQVAVPASLAPVTSAALPEALVRGLAETGEGAIRSDAAERVLDLAAARRRRPGRTGDGGRGADPAAGAAPATGTGRPAGPGCARPGRGDRGPGLPAPPRPGRWC